MLISLMAREMVAFVARLSRTQKVVAILSLLLIVAHALFHPWFFSRNSLNLMSYTQTLDHFDKTSSVKFQQRYGINFKHWGGAAAGFPIFVKICGEGDLDRYPGFLFVLAKRFKGLAVSIEHRYYGESYPFGSTKEAYKNSSTLQYLSSSQALADYAEFITDLKKNLSASGSPVITIGGSYAGMLAAWFRLGYPHIVVGALASSAPVLYYNNPTHQDRLFNVVSNDFNEISESCYGRIKKSWFEIDKIASSPNGLDLLSQKFQTCLPLANADILKYTFALRYFGIAMHEYLIGYSVNKFCRHIDDMSEGADVLGLIATAFKEWKWEQYGIGHFLGRIFASVKPSCLPVDIEYNIPWNWQVCTELVEPSDYSEEDTMFQVNPARLFNQTRLCQKMFGVTSRPHWTDIKNNGLNMTLMLKNSGSNIIFSNGLRDPYSVGGILENISESIVAINTKQGSHCLDLTYSLFFDPEWLVAQRQAEIRIIEGWLK